MLESFDLAKRARSPDLVFLDEVEHLCSRAMILRDGWKIAEGSIEELRAMSGGATLEDSYIELVGGHA